MREKAAGGALSLVEHAARFRRGAAALLPAARRRGRAGGGRLGEQRRLGTSVAEARQAMLLARLKPGWKAHHFPRPAGKLLTRRHKRSRLATRGGAAVLGRTDIGSLEPGKCADFITINLHSARPG